MCRADASVPFMQAMLLRRLASGLILIAIIDRNRGRGRRE
jgi:hypothetical protein